MKYEKSLVIRIILFFVPLNFFYFLFTKPTIYGVKYSLFFYNPLLIENSLIIQDYKFNIISACVAGFAYFLLWILMLSTKDIRLLDRTKVFLFGALLLYIFNIIRISSLIFISINFGMNLFEQIHMFLWNLLSGIVVAIIWIISVKIFNIKAIPFYSDAKYLYKRSIFKGN